MIVFADKSVVTVAATDTALVTLARVKLELDITDAASDPLLTALIAEASSVLTTYLGRTLAEETVADTFRLDGPGYADAFMLSRWPVSAVAVVEGSETLVSGTDYEIDTDITSDRNDGTLWRLEDAVRVAWTDTPVVVTFTAGWDIVAGDLPAALTRACLDLVKQGWFAARRDPLVKSVAVDGIGRRDYWVGSAPGSASGLPVSNIAAVDRYRRISV